MCWICRRTAHNYSISTAKQTHAKFQGMGRLTGQDKKDNPVHNEHRPEHRDIKDTEPAADKPNGNGAGGALPELELRETANERTELVVLLSREECSCVAVLETFVLSERRVELGLKEKKEEVQKVDAESVGDYLVIYC